MKSRQERLDSLLKGVRVCLHIVCILDPSRVSSAFQAEENVVCNLECSVAHLSHCCHLESRSAVFCQEADLLPPFSVAVDSLIHISNMPEAPTKSAMVTLAASRQKVGNPKNFGAHPNSHFLKTLPNYQRMDMFNTMFNLYLSGRFFEQDTVSQEFWMEDPRPLTELLTRDGQWYDSHFRGVSNMLTALFLRSDNPHIRLLRRNGIQGDIVLIDFLQMDVMRRNFPTLCPASL